MKRNWDVIKWIFEPDGALRDIYVQEVSIEDWEKLIDFLNENYSLKYGISIGKKTVNRIDKEYAINYLTDESGKLESKSVSIDLGGIIANCHFFLPDQIEFDIDPKEIKSGEDFEKVEDFMSSISEILTNQVTLTEENDIEFPLIKVDVTKNINKVLTIEEIKEYRKKANTIKNQIGILKVKFLMRFFPEKLKERILKSASEPYKSTKKDKNVW